MLVHAVLFEDLAHGAALTDLPWREPREGEIGVRVRVTGICPSDLHTLRGRRPAPLPTVLGHETCGEVVALGPGEPSAIDGRPLKLGDRVVWALVSSCGSCRNCLADRPQKCEHGIKFGHRTQAADEPPMGGFAERVMLPAGPAVVVVPPTVDDEHAAIAGCAISTAVAACRVAGNLKNARVLVHGAGLLGIAVMERALDLGAAAVDVCERDARRGQEVDRRAGARRLDAAMLEAEGAAYDVAIDCTGDPEALTAQHRALDIGGLQILLGSVRPTSPFQTPPEVIVRKMLTIRGLHNYTPRDLVTAVGWLADTPGRFRDCLGETFALAEHEAAVTAAETGDSLRVFVRGGHES